ncbi:MAG TPA: hypothetical protein VMT62_07060 [Syntrophorhabdaceae bacterium]|nr:hypothetical protein [Syntrophorhabdaceae bacterium]
MVRSILVLLILLLIPLSVLSEIEKVGEPCENGICLAWWPKLTPVKGWHHERGPSFRNAINIQVPDGSTFSDAETVIYARALYKPAVPEIKSLDFLIKDDQEEFMGRDPAITVTEVRALKTGDGRLLKSYTFFPKSEGNWEQVSYGEESDFYLIFTISSRSRAGYEKTLSIYEQYIGQYREGP